MARNYGCRVTTDMTYRGLRTAVLENEFLRVGILLDKGAEVYEFLYKPADVDFMYLAPWGVQNPREDVPSISGPGGTFLDYYSGGWQEILPNGGPPTVVRGAAYGQHGDVSLVPWQAEVVEDSPERVALVVSVKSRRSPLALRKELALERGRPVLRIREWLTNESPDPFEFMWGHHIAFGGVALEPGVRVDAPAKRLLVHDVIPGFGPRRLEPGSVSAWPVGKGVSGEPIDFSLIPPVPPGGFEEMTYLTELDEGWYSVTHPERRIGFALRWEEARFPYLWFWQQFQGGRNFPWWGRVHTYALEPWTSYPTNGLEEAIRNGTAARLAGGETVETQLVAVVHQGFSRVERVTFDGDVSGK